MVFNMCCYLITRAQFYLTGPTFNLFSLFACFVSFLRSPHHSFPSLCLYRLRSHLSSRLLGCSLFWFSLRPLLLAPPTSLFLLLPLVPQIRTAFPGRRRGQWPIRG